MPCMLWGSQPQETAHGGCLDLTCTPGVCPKRLQRHHYMKRNMIARPQARGCPSRGTPTDPSPQPPAPTTKHPPRPGDASANNHNRPPPTATTARECPGQWTFRKPGHSGNPGQGRSSTGRRCTRPRRDGCLLRQMCWWSWNCREGLSPRARRQHHSCSCSHSCFCSQSCSCFCSCFCFHRSTQAYGMTFQVLWVTLECWCGVTSCNTETEGSHFIPAAQRCVTF